MAVFGYLLYPAVIHRLHEGIAVVKEICALFAKRLYGTEVPVQRFVNKPAEPFPVAVQQLRPLFKRERNGAIAALVRIVAGGLVA